MIDSRDMLPFKFLNSVKVKKNSMDPFSILDITFIFFPLKLISIGDVGTLDIFEIINN